MKSSEALLPSIPAVFSCLPPSPLLCGVVYSSPFTINSCKDDSETLLLTQDVVTDNYN